MEANFMNKRALVTGAGRGIGRSIVVELAKRGAKVVAISRTKAYLDSLKKEVPDIETISVDISNWKETEDTIKSLGSFDLLVNNAGVANLQEVGAITEEEFDKCFSVNLKAAINISQIVANGMKCAGKGGSIVNISSQAALIALHKHATYCASKAALDQFSKVMALELGQYQIRVNCVNPTVVLTDMAKEAWGDPAVASAMKAKIPLGKFCEIDDVVKTVVFLLSDQASMITGAQIPIDASKKAKQNEKTGAPISNFVPATASSNHFSKEKRKRKKVQRLICASESDDDSDVERTPRKRSPADIVQEQTAFSPTINSEEPMAVYMLCDISGQQHAQEIEFVKNPYIHKPTSESTLDGSHLTAHDKEVLSLLSTIKKQNDQILNLFSKQHENNEVSVTFPVPLPLVGEYDCQVLNEYLQDEDNFAQMCSYLVPFGEHNITSTTFRMLKNVLSYELASQYSYKGQQKKKSFEELPIRKAIVRSVQRCHKEAKNKEVEDCIKNWLRHAPAKLKKRLSKIEK